MEDPGRSTRTPPGTEGTCPGGRRRPGRRWCGGWRSLKAGSKPRSQTSQVKKLQTSHPELFGAGARQPAQNRPSYKPAAQRLPQPPPIRWPPPGAVAGIEQACGEGVSTSALRRPKPLDEDTDSQIATATA
jgi:hypothetical protein